MKEIAESEIMGFIPPDATHLLVISKRNAMVNKLLKISADDCQVYNRATKAWSNRSRPKIKDRILAIKRTGTKKQKPKYKMTRSRGGFSDCTKCCFGSLVVDCLSMKHPECCAIYREDGKNYYFELIDVRTN